MQCELTILNVFPDVDECASTPWEHPEEFDQAKGFMAPLCTNCTFDDDLEFINPLYKTFAGEYFSLLFIILENKVWGDVKQISDTKYFFLVKCKNRKHAMSDDY